MSPDELDDALLDAPLPASLTRPEPARRSDLEAAALAASFTLEPFGPDDDDPVGRSGLPRPAPPCTPSPHVEPVSVAEVVPARRPVVVVERRARSDSGLHVAMALGAGCSFLALAVLVWSWLS